jgi:hypothetical protein
VDTHTRGKLADVKRFFDLLRKKLPISTPVINERGGGAWLLVSYRELRHGNVYQTPSAERWNALVKRMQEWTRTLAAEHQLDVEHVEVHGRVLEASNKSGEWRAVTCPGLMKAPPSTDHLPEEVVTFAGLAGMDWSVTKEAKAQVQKAKLQAGSVCRESVLTAEHTKRLPDLVSAIRCWFPDRPTHVRERWISDRQFAEVVAVLVFTPTQKDGSNPYAVHKAQINQMHEEGVLTYSYSHEVYAVVRDFLSDKGLIAWEDETYCPTIRDARGKVITKGRAMRWEVGEVLAELVEAVLEPVTGGGDEASLSMVHRSLPLTPLTGPHESRRPRLTRPDEVRIDQLAPDDPVYWLLAA